jgi:hypothetical protein
MSGIHLSLSLLFAFWSLVLYIAPGFVILLLASNNDRIDRVTRHWSSGAVWLALLTWPVSIFWIAWKARRARV